MAQKKRGTNPIRITLTEDQISDIIQSAAKTRRGLKVENLEERIAPSAIGVPLFDPNLPGDAPPPAYDPANPPPDGFFSEPPLPGPLPGDLDPEAGFVPPPDFDPNNAPPLGEPPLPGLVDPLNPESGFVPPPDGLPGDPLHSGPLGGSTPPLPGTPDAFRLHHQETFESHGFTAPGTETPTTDTPTDPAAYQQASHQVANDVREVVNQGGTMPTADEIDEHRRNILRQLRGA